MAIEHQPLSSSMVTHGGHDGETTGEVKIGGKTYRIHGIDAAAWAAFTGAESLGKHYNAHIKGNPDYRVERVES